MRTIRNFPAQVKNNGAGSALDVYEAALDVYQERRTPKTKAVVFVAYRHWARSLFDDEAEADRAADNFIAALAGGNAGDTDGHCLI